MVLEALAVPEALAVLVVLDPAAELDEDEPLPPEVVPLPARYRVSS
jgi:hypothetical protein